MSSIVCASSPQFSFLFVLIWIKQTKPLSRETQVLFSFLIQSTIVTPFFGVLPFVDRFLLFFWIGSFRCPRKSQHRPPTTTTASWWEWSQAPDSVNCNLFTQKWLLQWIVHLLPLCLINGHHLLFKFSLYPQIVPLLPKKPTKGCIPLRLGLFDHFFFKWCYIVQCFLLLHFHVGDSVNLTCLIKFVSILLFLRCWTFLLV